MAHNGIWSLTLGVCCGLVFGQPPLVSDSPPIPGEVRVIGRSGEGRNIGLVVLSTEGDPDAKPGIVIVAGLDGRHTIGVEVALGVARRLVEQHAELLRTHTVYVLANANPDAVARWRAGGPRIDWGGTLTPRDDDRDRRIDEDPPTDVNGDGHITMMRVRLPSPMHGLTLTHVIDTDDPRLMRAPDANKGEHATHAVLVEGFDADGDGRIAEDGPGGVDLDRNFPYLWPEAAADAGAYPLCEPESRAIADWLIERQNVVAVIVYGPKDTIVRVPAAGRMDVTGRVPLGTEEDDRATYDALSEAFKEVTRQQSAPAGDNAGSLQGWAYAHMGLLSFSTPVWVRPDQLRREGGDRGEGSGAVPAQAPTPQPRDERAELIAQGATPQVAEFLTAAPERRRAMAMELLSMPAEEREAMQAEFLKMPTEIQSRVMQEIQRMRPEGSVGSNNGALFFSQPATGRPARRGGAAQPGPAPGASAPGVTANTSEEGKWLAYSDERGEGFVEWQPFVHPTLGKVEIGGFIPGFRLNPPEMELDRLVDEQTAVVAMLLSRMARPVADCVLVEPLGEGVWRIGVRVINAGELPTRLSIGVKARRRAPMRLRMDIEDDRILSGSPRRLIQRLAKGERHDSQWIVRGAPGSRVTVLLETAEYGTTVLDIPLEPRADQGGER
ncbi:MAG: hypothetical protein KIT24_12445 [Phycisphaeraceae bacterium]|nr:hypothetical protein [Phycisphaeraceae bacterium]